LAIQPSGCNVGGGDDGVAARTRIEHRQLANDVAGSGKRDEVLPSAFTATFDLHCAGADDIDAIARVALGEDQLAGREGDRVKALRSVEAYRSSSSPIFAGHDM
jgi:hypothetical protein